MAVQSREEWTRQTLAALDAFCAGRRSGTTSCGGSTDLVEAEDPPAHRSEARGGNDPPAPPCPERYLKVYPDLGAACLRERLDLSYRLWLLLRQEQSGGRGWLTKDHVFALSCWTQRETLRWLQEGLHTFWHWYEDRLYLHSLESVSKALGVPPEKHAARVPMEQIENLQAFRAAVYAAWCIKPVTISQAKLASVFGRKPKTLQRWAKLAGLEVGHNLAWTPLPDEADLKEKAAEVKAQYYWTERWDGLPGKRRRRGDKPDELTALLWTQPNTYRSPYARAPKTRLQRHACQALSKLSTTSRAPGERVYCPRGPGQGRRAARLLEAGGIAFVEEVRQHHGYGLWEYQA